MKRPAKSNIFETYRPKGLPSARFTDGRYARRLESAMSIPSSPPSINTNQVDEQDQEQDGNFKDHVAAKKLDVLPISMEFINALGVEDSFKDELDKTFDLLFPLLPYKYHLQESSYLAEIIAFHVLKEKRIFIDPDEFVRASPVGNMNMCRRVWLLMYKQYLPAPIKFPPNPSPDKLLDQLYASPFFTEDFRNKCEEIKPLILKLSGNLHPKIAAGIICFVAFKSIPHQDSTMSYAFRLMGIKYPGSIHNAVRNLKSRWKSVWTVFFKKETAACRN